VSVCVCVSARRGRKEESRLPSSCAKKRRVKGEKEGWKEGERRTVIASFGSYQNMESSAPS